MQKMDVPGGKAQRQAQVSEQVNRMGNALGRTGEVISKMEDRLGSVLTQNAPCSTGVDKSPEPQLVPLAEELCRLVAIAESNECRMENILARVEL
jgi:hypothetical protein